ncbi:MAG: DNA repair exonuclease [Nanoarchaeota archaeon]
MKFAHMGDCHLGGWRQQELKELNMQSFSKAVEICINEKVEFILIAGDLFASAYPRMDSLKHAFEEFRKIKEANIPVFIIAGSHDYSVSGNTFLEVLEKAGFCKNVVKFEDRLGEIILEPTIYKNFAIYGYPGKKSGLEVPEIRRLKLQDSPGLFKILMLHTTIRDAIGSLPIDAVNEKFLPKVDYLALAHLHIKYQRDNRVYSGPTFPNSISELEELKGGSLYIFNNGSIKRQEIKTKEILSAQFEINNSLNVTDSIISYFNSLEVKDKIIILRLSGLLEIGKTSDIDFQKIEANLRQKGAFSFLKSTSLLSVLESENTEEFSNQDNLEENIISKFLEKNSSKYNSLIPDLIKSLQVSKLEDEASSSFESRLFSEVKKIINYDT